MHVFHVRTKLILDHIGSFTQETLRFSEVPYGEVNRTKGAEVSLVADFVIATCDVAQYPQVMLQAIRSTCVPYT